MPASFSYAPRLAGVPVLWNIMKIDIVSVFPEYFEVLNLSLLGKAQEKGLVESPRTTCATGRTTCTIPWMILPSAAARAW